MLRPPQKETRKILSFLVVSSYQHLSDVLIDIADELVKDNITFKLEMCFS